MEGVAGFDYYMHRFVLILVQYAYYSIDTFLFLGGFLGALSIYRNVHKMGNRPALYIPLAIIMRILRIWPMMMFVTLVQWQWSDQLPYGYNVWQRSAYTEGCANSWYYIALFVKMFVSDEKCMDVLWYIEVSYGGALLSVIDPRDVPQHRHPLKSVTNFET